MYEKYLQTLPPKPYHPIMFVPTQLQRVHLLVDDQRRLVDDPEVMIDVEVEVIEVEDAPSHECNIIEDLLIVSSS